MRAILDREACEDCREIDRCKIPIRDQSSSPRPAEQITNFRRAKASIDVHGKSAEPRASIEQYEIVRPVQAQDGDAIAAAHAELRLQRTRGLRDAFHKMRSFLMATKGLSEDEAISLISVAVDFGVTQVVDGNWGIHAIIKKSLFAGASA